jgi:hypothetical protein
MLDLPEPFTPIKTARLDGKSMVTSLNPLKFFIRNFSICINALTPLGLILY